METIIYWAGISDKKNTISEFILNHDVVNHLKLGEEIWLEEFYKFVEIIPNGHFYQTGLTLDELQSAILNIGNGPSKVENIIYSYIDGISYKVISLSED